MNRRETNPFPRLPERTAGWVCTWGEYLRGADKTASAEHMRRRERADRPLGDERFAKKLERLPGRRLLPDKPGRPSKRRSHKWHAVPPPCPARCPSKGDVTQICAEGEMDRPTGVAGEIT